MKLYDPWVAGIVVLLVVAMLLLALVDKEGQNHNHGAHGAVAYFCLFIAVVALARMLYERHRRGPWS